MLVRSAGRPAQHVLPEPALQPALPLALLTVLPLQQ